METADWIAVIAWVAGCGAVTAGALGMIFHNQLVRLSLRLRAAVHHATRDRRHDDLPEHIRAMLARRPQPAVEGRGQHWVEGEQHTGAILRPAKTAAPKAETRELESAVA